jgi:hypothetical protein
MQLLARERTTGIVYIVTMPYNSKEQTPYDQFNFEIPERFPSEGISARAAKAIVTSETWTDANPMLNLSSFVTTFCEPEAKDIHDASMFRNFADPDMYPHTKETEFKCIQWLHDLWNGPRQGSVFGEYKPKKGELKDDRSPHRVLVRIGNTRLIKAASLILRLSARSPRGKD